MAQALQSHGEECSRKKHCRFEPDLSVLVITKNVQQWQIFLENTGQLIYDVVFLCNNLRKPENLEKNSVLF